MPWIPGDVSGSETLTNNDHLYASHINEIRTAVDARVLKIGTNPVSITIANGTNVVALTITQNNIGNVSGLVINHAANSGGSQAALRIVTSGNSTKGINIVDTGLSGNCIKLPMQTAANHRPKLVWRDFTNDQPVVALMAHEKHSNGDDHRHFSLYTTDELGVGQGRFNIQFSRQDVDVSFSKVATVQILNTDSADTPSRYNRNYTDNALEVHSETRLQMLVLIRWRVKSLTSKQIRLKHQALSITVRTLSILNSGVKLAEESL
jgi:hypothetical protein